MPNKVFLETTPLYTKFDTDYEFDTTNSYTFIAWSKVPKPAIHMPCQVCKSEQTYNMVGDYKGIGTHSSSNHVHGKVEEIRYLCSSCRNNQYIFLVNFGYKAKNKKGECQIYLEKVGQFPAWNKAIDKELESILGEKSEYLKRGLICESHGFGIGAFGYYRRIVEEIIDQLLSQIGEIIPEEDKNKYAEALEKTKNTHVAQDKIDLVKDLVPTSLKPGGMNPLGVVYSAVSEGLHNLSEDDCMKKAEIIRSSLTYLVNQVMKTQKESKQFTESMRTLLGKKI